MSLCYISDFPYIAVCLWSCLYLFVWLLFLYLNVYFSVFLCVNLFAPMDSLSFLLEFWSENNIFVKVLIEIYININWSNLRLFSTILIKNEMFNPELVTLRLDPNLCFLHRADWKQTLTRKKVFHKTLKSPILQSFYFHISVVYHLGDFYCFLKWMWL